MKLLKRSIISVIIVSIVLIIPLAATAAQKQTIVSFR